MLSILIGNDIEDINKLNIIVNKLDTIVCQEENLDSDLAEAFNWLKNIQNILTDSTYGQEMYDTVDLLS